MKYLFLLSALVLMTQGTIVLLKVDTPGTSFTGNYKFEESKKISRAFIRLTHEEVAAEDHQWVRNMEKNLRASFLKVPEDQYTYGPPDPDRCQLTIERPFTVHEPYVLVSTKNCEKHTVFYTNPAIVEELGKKLICEADALQRSRKLHEVFHLLAFLLSLGGLAFVFLSGKDPSTDKNVIYI